MTADPTATKLRISTGLPRTAIRGIVQGTKIEGGRYGIKLNQEPDGLGKIVRVWEEAGRTWTRVKN